MSATNRGGTRRKQDDYQTPPAVIRHFMDSVLLQDPFLTGEILEREGIFLEPCCGTGNILKEVIMRLNFDHLFAIDINNDHLRNLEHELHTLRFLPYRTVTGNLYQNNPCEENIASNTRRIDRNVTLIQEDFLSINYIEPDLIITNPPYSLAQEFIQHSLEILSAGGIAFFLLRLAFLEGQKRKKFHEQHPVKWVFSLSKRPSFTGSGTDATAYAWFGYRKNEQSWLANSPFFIGRII